MGQDIEVYITTENTVTTGGVNGYVTVTDAGVATNRTGSSLDLSTEKIFAGPLSGSLGFVDADDFGVPMVQNVSGLDVSIGAMDEDVTYFGLRQVTKAEIKKETTVTLTRKKDDLVYDAIFNGNGRYGTSGASFNSGLVEPTVNHGYRLHIVLRDGTEVMSIPGMCVQSHTVTTNVDGSADETLEFMSYITPSYGQTPDQVKLGATEL